MTLTRREVLARSAVVAGAAAAPLAVLPPPTAAAHRGFLHVRRPERVRARRWTVLGSVPAVRSGAGLYLAQLALVDVRGGWGQLRFHREPGHDGTGDLDFVIHKGAPRWNVTHSHVVGGFAGRMRASIWLSRGATVRYRVLKAVAL